MERLHIGSGPRGYDIIIGSGILDKIKDFFEIRNKVLVVTDKGVPKEYSERIARALGAIEIFTVPEGEGAKSLEIYGALMRRAAELELSRGDIMVGVGGGVVGDLTGFCASTYMRGIAFYNIPTTLLSAVDSSVGGKCAVNLGGVKNIIGSFYPPRGVLIDTDTLKTLPKRQFSAGLCEAIKMSLTSNAELFEFFEQNDINADNVTHVITEALKIKADVVEADEYEKGLRKILNFGHTLGHGIEAAEGLSGLLHGECVALGMIPMCSDEVKERLIPVLKKNFLPTEWEGNLDLALALTRHDKKRSDDGIDAVFVPSIGEYEIRNVSFDDFEIHVKNRLIKDK